MAEKIYATEAELHELFVKGLAAYRAGEFFDAHEHWEDMWHNKNMPDRRFIQGLIQLTASFYKIQVGNINGARKLLAKSQEKFEDYAGLQRGIDVDDLCERIREIARRYEEISDTDQFDLNTVPEI
jgi:predicted metal-dependent hydrolase